MKTTTFIGGINDAELVLTCLEPLFVIWFDEATRCAESPDAKKSIALFTNGMRAQLQGIIRDLSDRRKMLSEPADYGVEEYRMPNGDLRTARRSGTRCRE